MTIVFQMTNRVPNFIEQSHLETTEGMKHSNMACRRALTLYSLDSLLVTDSEDSHASVPQPMPRNPAASVWSAATNVAVE